MDYVFAVAILLCPPDTKLTGEESRFARYVIEVAVDLELIEKDGDIVGLILGDFNKFIAVLRERRMDLYDAPPSSDVSRFPDQYTVCKMIDFNREYRKCLENQLGLSFARDEGLRAAIDEVDRLHCVWDYMRECHIYYINHRRMTLKRIRELIGEEAYYAGRLPPHVPIWRFEQR